MYSNDPITFIKERRRRPDPLNRLLDAMSVIVWLVLFLSLAITRNAMPQVETFFDRVFDVKLRQHWDYQVLIASIVMLSILFVICCVTIYLNTKRLKRAGDRFSRIGSRFRRLLVGNHYLACFHCIITHSYPSAQS
jgi:hypothetical protein